MTGVHAEQKNWARVRELVGYYRYDTAAELARLNEISALDARFTNYFLPSRSWCSSNATARKSPRDTTRSRHPSASRGPR
jgi:hypothetical protein